jgi:hypothetical protein
MKVILSLTTSLIILSQSGGLKVLAEIFSRASELNHVLQAAQQVIR